MKSSLKSLGFLALGSAATLALVFAVRARAAGIPDADVLTYTGYLADGDGAPLTGDHSIAVRFWAAAEGGSALCTGELASVELKAGRFQVPLPAECVDAVRANPDLFVDVAVDGSSLGRTKLGAVPYAVEAGHASSASAADTAEHAAVASDADGDLEDRITALEVVPGLVLDLVDARAGDPEYAECRGQTGGLVYGVCARMAHYTCKNKGYVTGWFRGDAAPEALGLICVK